MYLNHTFGETEQTEDYEYVDLQKDIETLTICVDKLNKGHRHRDFEGFEFTQYGEYGIKLMPKCGRRNYVDFDLVGKRLIGFKVILSDYTDAPPFTQDRRNIRSICPLYDEIDCTDTVFCRVNY